MRASPAHVRELHALCCSGAQAQCQQLQQTPLPGANMLQLTWEHLACLEPKALRRVQLMVLEELGRCHLCVRAVEDARELVTAQARQLSTQTSLSQ